MLKCLTWSCWTVVEKILNITEWKVVHKLLYQILNTENSSMNDKSAIWYWKGKFSFHCDHWGLCNIMERLVAQTGLAKLEKKRSVMMIDAQTDLNLEHVWETILSQSLMSYTKHRCQRNRKY